MRQPLKACAVSSSTGERFDALVQVLRGHVVVHEVTVDHHRLAYRGRELRQFGRLTLLQLLGLLTAVIVLPVPVPVRPELPAAFGAASLSVPPFTCIRLALFLAAFAIFLDFRFLCKYEACGIQQLFFHSGY